MPTYISLIKYTHQGISTVKQGPARLGANKETLNRFGSELKAFYLTMGRYDIVTISEAPDDTAAARVALTVGAPATSQPRPCGPSPRTTARSLRLCPDARS
jgi:uncharacterized protein with GYD domain